MNYVLNKTLFFSLKSESLYELTKYSDLMQVTPKTHIVSSLYNGHNAVSTWIAENFGSGTYKNLNTSLGVADQVFHSNHTAYRFRGKRDLNTCG